jgi:hypothetical protein
LLSSLGPIWPAARDNAAIVIENNVPATAIIEPATAPSNVRAPAAPPSYNHFSRSDLETIPLGLARLR